MLPKKEKSTREKIKKGLSSIFALDKGKNKEKKNPAVTPEVVAEPSTVNSQQLFSDKQYKEKIIILIGSTGKGKSTLANVLVNKNNNLEELFKESEASVSGTKEIQKEEFIINDINYQIIDTVGIGDTELSKDEVLDKIAEAVYWARNGISQVFFVINGRLGKNEMANYDLLRTIIFDEKVVNHTTIIRTRFKEFENKDGCQNDINLMVKEGGN